MDNFYKKLFFVAFPIIIRTTVSSFSGFIDNLMIGQLGSNAITAVSVVNQILFIFICTITGTIAGASIFSSQYFGIKDYNGVKKVFYIKFTLSIVVFLLYSLFVYTFYYKLISLFTISGDVNIKNEVTYSCNQYFLFSFLSLIPFWIANIFSTTISESGDTLKPMMICLLCVILNTFLNYCFINGNLGFPQMDIYGASLATFISRFIEMILVIILALKTNFFNGFFREIAIDMNLLKDVFKKSIPLFIDEFLFSFSLVVGIQIYSLRAVDNVTIMSIATIVNAFFINLMVSLGIASEIILGHELGQNKLEQANTYAHRIIKITILLSVILSFFIYLLSLHIPYFYNVKNILQLHTTKCIQVYAYSFVITSLSCVLFFIIRSGGNTLILSLIDGVFIWLVELPLEYLLINFTSLDLHTIYFIILLSAILKIFIGFMFIKNKMWLTNLIKEK